MPRLSNKGKNSKKVPKIEESSGNVFLDLGYPEAESINIVARLQLMMQIEEIIKDQGWTQEQAAKNLGLRQARVSELMSSRSEKFTVDMLMKLLYRLGKQVVLTVENKTDVAPGTHERLDTKKSLNWYESSEVLIAAADSPSSQGEIN